MQCGCVCGMRVFVCVLMPNSPIGASKQSKTVLQRLSVKDVYTLRMRLLVDQRIPCDLLESCLRVSDMESAAL